MSSLYLKAVAFSVLESGWLLWDRTDLSFMEQAHPVVRGWKKLRWYGRERDISRGLEKGWWGIPRFSAGWIAGVWDLIIVNLACIVRGSRRSPQNSLRRCLLPQPRPEVLCWGCLIAMVASCCDPGIVLLLQKKTNYFRQTGKSPKMWWSSQGTSKRLPPFCSKSHTK